MVPINKSKISNGVRLPRNFNKLSIGGAAHRKDYEHVEDESGGRRVRQSRI